MEHKELFEKLYEPKMPDTFDLKILLFYYCKMGCGFCIQKIWDKTGMDDDSIKKKADIAIDALSKSDKKFVDLTIFGGEMFGDFVPDDLFDSYFYLLDTVNKYCISAGKKLTVTNFNSLWYRKKERVKNLLDRCSEAGIRVDFGVSYDLTGRFSNPAMHKIFVENEKYFSKYIVKFNTVLTKQAIEIIKRPEGINDPFFDYMYSKYLLGLRHYAKDEYIQKDDVDHSQWMHESEQDLHDAYMYMYDNYPKGDSIQTALGAIYSTVVRKNECPGDRETILPDNSTVYCVSSATCGNGCGPLAYIKFRGCLDCEYFKTCRVDCFYEEMDPNIKKMDGCLYKNIYKSFEKREALLNGGTKLEDKTKSLSYDDWS